MFYFIDTGEHVLSMQPHNSLIRWWWLPLQLLCCFVGFLTGQCKH